MMTIILTALWATAVGILAVVTSLFLSFTVQDILNRDGPSVIIGSLFTSTFAFLTCVAFMLKPLVLS
jgi:hypothetical protein